MDAGHEVHEASEEQKAALSAEAAEAARSMGQQALRERLEAISMGADQAELYERYYSQVKTQTQQLRQLFESLETTTTERVWQRDQLAGDLDDTKLIDALTGSVRVYRQRGTPTPQSGLPPLLTKRLCFVLDVSGSMYRFNGHDGRLTRVVETALLIMEALHGRP